MPRVRKGAARRQAKKRILKDVRGYRGQTGKQYRLAKEARVRAAVNARVGRKLKKRDFRALWIIRLNAACRQRGPALQPVHQRLPEGEDRSEPQDAQRDRD